MEQWKNRIFEEPAKHKPILGTSIGRTPIRVDKMGGKTGNGSIRKRRHRNSKSRRTKPQLVEPSQPVYEVEIIGETETQRKTERYERKKSGLGKPRDQSA